MLWQMLPWLRVWGLSQQTVKLAEYWLPTTLRNLSGYQRSNWRTGWLPHSSAADAPSPRDQPVLVLTANTAWNLAHFRALLLQAFADRGFLLVALAPVDASVLRLQAMGVVLEP